MTERDLLAADSIPSRAADPARFVTAVIITYNCYTSIEQTILAVANQVGRVILLTTDRSRETQMRSGAQSIVIDCRVVNSFPRAGILVSGRPST